MEKNFLKTPINIRQLIQDGAEFEVDSGFSIEQMYDHFMEDDYGSADEVEDEESCRKMRNPWDRSFDELRQVMNPVSEFLYKRITQMGVGEPVSGINKRVTLEYNAFWENDLKPFDSTTLREIPYDFILGSSDVLPGLDRAVHTMCVGEEAQFLISYHLLFGELGCPPRIRPQADALFVIQLDSCKDVGNAKALSDLEDDERRSFAVVKEKIVEIRNCAKDLFQRELLPNAIHRYLEAVDALQLCEVADEKERKEQHAMLATVYTSLAVCYNRKEQPWDTCRIVNDARRVCDVNQHAKLLYQEGKALQMLGEYVQSRKSFVRAQELRPTDEQIHQAIKELEERSENHRQTEKDMWTRALNISKLKWGNASGMGKKFLDNVKEMVKLFLQDETSTKLLLPDDLSQNERDILKDIADKFNLKFTVYMVDNVEHYSLKK